MTSHLNRSVLDNMPERLHSLDDDPSMSKHGTTIVSKDPLHTESFTFAISRTTESRPGSFHTRPKRLRRGHITKVS